MIRITLLLALLAAQLGWIWHHQTAHRQGQQAAGPLLPLTSTVEEIEISDARQSVTLKRSEAGWKLVQPMRFPADQSTIDGLLDTLGDLTTGTAIAQSSAAHDRFEVSEQTFQRRLRLTGADGTQQTLYIGRNTDLRNAYLRLHGQAGIQTGRITATTVPGHAGHWQDRSQLFRKADKLKSLRIAQTRLVNTDTGWKHDTAADDSTTINIEELIQYATTIRYTEALSPDGAWPLKTPALRIHYAPKQGSGVDCEFHQQQTKPYYLAYCSDRPQIFVIPLGQLRPLLPEGAAVQPER